MASGPDDVWDRAARHLAPLNTSIRRGTQEQEFTVGNHKQHEPEKKYNLRTSEKNTVHSIRIKPCQLTLKDWRGLFVRGISTASKNKHINK